MYKTIYQSTTRVHTMQEAMQITPDTPTDMFLYLIDIYDLIIKGERCPALAIKLKTYLRDNYTKLHVPIPGCLYGWTHSMFVFIIYLHLIEPTYTYNKNWIKQHRLRLYKDPDPKEWSWDTFISMLDLVSLKWNELPQCAQLEELLGVLTTLAKKFCLYIHTKDALSVDMHTHDVSNTKYHVRLSPESIVSVMRVVMFRFHGYTIQEIQLPSNNMDHFLHLEKRHLVSRKFREGVCSWMWDRIILIGEKAIASHDQLGENVSSFTCLFKRHPAGQLTAWQRQLTYNTYDKIDDRLKEYIHLHLIDQHFQSIYNIGFIKYFVVFDVFKHKKNIETCKVPLLLCLQDQYHVHWSGVHRGGTVKDAFVIWVHFIKLYLDCKPYNMDFSLLVSQMFESLSDEDTLEGYWTLHDGDL